MAWALRDQVRCIAPNTLAPEKGQDRFAGYAVMGLPFRSGHVLALRRFSASSVGPAYTSVWHRNPEGRWTFYSTVPETLGCGRYFSKAVDTEIRADIRLEWIGPAFLRVSIGGSRPVWWEVQMRATLATRIMNASGQWMPESWWRNRRVLRGMGLVARAAFRTGRMNLAGRTPNGHEFIANPRRVWMVESSRAVVDDVDLGPLGPLDKQAHLNDVWIPQRGVFAIVQAALTPPAKRTADLAAA